MAADPPSTASELRRLDVELVRQGLARSRGQARELIDMGVVLVDGRPGKASTKVAATTAIRLTAEPDRWVGRAAYKLLEALRVFGPAGLGVTNARCLDVGASTGGFTQVLLEAGAAHVTALDVGHGQLVTAIAGDPRVEERSGMNIRDVAAGDLGAEFDVVVADLSFISLSTALPAMVSQLRPGGDLVALVKPQFEVGRDRLARTGVVTSRAERRRVLGAVVGSARRLGVDIHGITSSPIRGAEGNREYLLWVRQRSDGAAGTSEAPAPLSEQELDALVADVTSSHTDSTTR
ncbi:TlyA family RNA methyltransferase [Lapillicoccus sp.]|uniref:TlyA family RNA methyltransferase n=1 Tax=Lapillicoccus sp. TaxID=1909287 RepID=UPI003266C899